MIPFHKIYGRLGNNLFQGAYIYAQMRRGQVPDIFVQDPMYFDDYRNEIRSLFGDGITQIDKVAIHVRRGDYVNNDFYVDLSKTDYYKEAIKEFPNSEFIVFSDDIAFCKEYFKDYNFEYSEGKTELEDLNTMASCKGIIIANSSFSWWSAYLSSAKIIAPKAWYTDGIERTKCLNEWKRL